MITTRDPFALAEAFTVRTLRDKLQLEPTEIRDGFAVYDCVQWEIRIPVNGHANVHETIAYIGILAKALRMPPRDLYAVFMDPDSVVYNVKHTNWRGRTTEQNYARYTRIDGGVSKKWHELPEYLSRRAKIEKQKEEKYGNPT